jgi:DNA-directed RNA polymerase specialized sigma24 family protein
MEADASTELRKIANLLALRQIEGKTKGDQARLLNAAGFGNDEVARLVGITEGSVRAHVSQGRKRVSEDKPVGE